MPLVKAGQIVEDQYVRVEDDAPLPDGVPVLLTAARFLADARDLVERDAPVGVIWPMIAASPSSRRGSIGSR